MQSAAQWRNDFRGLNLHYKFLGEAISRQYLQEAAVGYRVAMVTDEGLPG